MRRLLTAFALALALPVLAAPAAQAQQVNAPPGLSGVDEYLETVPGAGGAERPGGGTGPNGDPAPGEIEAKTGTAIPADTVRELRAAGEDGERVARLAATNAPVDPTGRPASGAVRGETLRDEGGTSAAGAITAVLTGSAGAGVILPLSLAVLTLALGAAALRRRHAA